MSVSSLLIGVARLCAIRCDNELENLSSKLTEWAWKGDSKLSHIQPGKSQQNAYIKRYNRMVRYN